MMSCEEFTDRVTAYLEGRVPMGERFGMFFHALMCKHCKRYLQQMKMVVDLMGDIPTSEPTEGPDRATKEELLEKFRQKTAGSTGRSD